MNVLILGSGGREHALAWKTARSPAVERVFVAPGNAGTQREPGVENVPIQATDTEGLIRFARQQNVALTIVGPEAPLVTGVVDAFQAAGLRCFGPGRDAARLEGSKRFAKEFMARHAIPTAGYNSFTEPQAAHTHIRKTGAPVVVKADGLAAGKGVIVAATEQEAIAAVDMMLAGSAFGDAGRCVVIEEFLRGEEISFIVMADGEHILPLATSQDHKPRDDGDTGPNTGGMGAYSPAPLVTPGLHARIMREIIEPTVRGLAAEGTLYTGFLYAGLMICPDGTPKVLEYNCRFGDPETQPILMRLESDLVELCELALERRLDQATARWDPRAALGVVMAAGGYPGSYRKGDIIRGLGEDPPDLKVFHAGTAIERGQVVTNGGRVLCVTALGESIAAARQRAYDRVGGIHWNDAYYRTDIGHRAVGRG